jgi:hypothetical protein
MDIQYKIKFDLYMLLTCTLYLIKIDKYIKLFDYYNMNSKTTTIIFSILAITVAAAITITLMSTAKNNVLAQEQTEAAADGRDLLIVQNTSMSAQDPVPGHESHQLALVAPPRQDGKIWSGVVTFTASKPVDVVVLHPYNVAQKVDEERGEPLHAPNPFAKGQNIAITLMTKYTDEPIFAGSLPFAGTALAFHTTTGEPFTVTYTLDAEAKSPTTITTSKQ